jgi:hypothetical protein
MSPLSISSDVSGEVYSVRQETSATILKNEFLRGRALGLDQVELQLRSELSRRNSWCPVAIQSVSNQRTLLLLKSAYTPPSEATTSVVVALFDLNAILLEYGLKFPKPLAYSFTTMRSVNLGSTIAHLGGKH